MIQFQFFPRSKSLPKKLKKVIDCFEKDDINAVNVNVDNLKQEPEKEFKKKLKEQVQQKKLEGILKIQKQLKSNQVLAKVRAPLKENRFSVEEKKENGFSVEEKKENGFSVEGKKENNDTVIEIGNGKQFRVDAISRCKEKRIIIEVEGGQTTYARKCYYDIFKACMIDEVDYVVIAVPIYYLHRKGENSKNTNSNPKEIVIDEVYKDASKEIEAIFESRFGKRLPLKGILLIGY